MPPRFGRRRRLASQAFTLESSRVLATFEPICKLWALRILVELGGHSEAVLETHIDEPDLLRFLGIDSNTDLTEFDQDVVLRQLRRVHREVSTNKPVLPEQTDLVANAVWMQKHLGLNEVDILILSFCVLERHLMYLSMAIEHLGEMNELGLYSKLAVVLGVPAESVAQSLAANGTLARTGLMQVDRSEAYQFRDKLEMPRGLAERMLAHHENAFDLFSACFVVASEPTLSVERFDHLQPKINHLAQYLRHAIETQRKGVNVLVYGPPGTGKTELTLMLARDIGADLFEVAVKDGLGGRLAGKHRLAAYTLTQRILYMRDKTLVLFDEIEDIGPGLQSDDDDDDFFSSSNTYSHIGKAWFNQMLENNTVPAIWISNRISQIDPAHLRRFDYHLQVNTPPQAVRMRILNEYVSAMGASAGWCRSMADNDHLAPAVVARAARVVGAMKTAGVVTPVESLLEEVIDGALRAQRKPTSPRSRVTDSLAYRMDGLQAASDLTAILDGLRSHPQARFCLFGPPGTGKSAFARHVALELGMPTMVKRGSDLVSPYVGQTEQQMAEMFRSAAESRAVLILDEADSFLQSREQARNSWEVTAVNEMLTQLEAFEGLFFATTNLMDKMDAASLRRFDAKIAFDYLRPAQCCVLLQEACRTLGLETKACEESAQSLTQLTPGDFAAVLRQSRFNPVKNVQDLIHRLRDEVQHKRLPTGKGIGFVLPVTA